MLFRSSRSKSFAFQRTNTLLCVVLTNKRWGRFNLIWKPVAAETAVNSRGHHCSGVEEHSCRSQPPRCALLLLLLLKMTVTWTLFSTTQWIFWFITFSLCLRAQYFPVRSFFFLFFFIPTFVVHLLGWDCRLGSAACNTYFSHFAVVIECSTDFCSFLLICYCSTPCLPLYLLFCAGSLLYTSFWAEARDWFSLIIFSRSRNRHVQ